MQEPSKNNTFHTISNVVICIFIIAITYLFLIFLFINRSHCLVGSRTIPSVSQGQITLAQPAMYTCVPFYPLLKSVIVAIAPYVSGGIYLGIKKITNPFKHSILIGLITTLGERLFIIIAAILTLQGFKQVSSSGETYYVEGSENIIGSITSEALPYFN